MKTTELRALSKEEIAQKLNGWKKELVDLRMQAAAGKLDKSHRISEARKGIAKAVTLLKELEREEDGKPASSAGQKKG